MQLDPNADNSALELLADARMLGKELLFQRGLYASIDLEKKGGVEANRMLAKGNIGTTDCYCTTCKKETPFIVQPMPVANSGGGLRHGDALYQPPSIFGVRAICQRDLNTYVFSLYSVSGKLFKIGQYPSTAEISLGELRGIDRGLQQEGRAELGKALGLFAHDSALGAFVYLRRVFERMINRAYDRQSQSDKPIANFSGLKMEQKIAALKDELPDKVVQNSAVFSVLSLGIHDLTDEKCQTIFPLMKAIIFQMLEQEEHKRRKVKGEQATDSALQALLSVGLKPDP